MGTAIDITGHVFGRLTALRRVGTHRSGAALWECTCNCGSGKQKTTTIDSLRQGDSRSCGCMRGAKALDLTGQQFGLLTALYPGDKDKRSRLTWVCRCSCIERTIKTISSDALRNGGIKSCGCTLRTQHARDLTGMTFGKLFVVRRDGNYYSKPAWLCRCSCDAETEVQVDSYRLTKGITRSCGCLRYDLAQDLTGQRFGKLTVLYRATDLKAVKARGIQWVAQCDCDPQQARLRTLLANDLTRGAVGSCGCAVLLGEIVRSEKARKLATSIQNRRYRVDLQFTMRVRVKALIHQSLKRKRILRTGRTLKNLGFTAEDLISRLLSTMPKGYSWSDFLCGKLHIDHIIPLSRFSYTADTDVAFKEAWALSNLQLLPAEQNRSKGNKLNWKPDAEI